jgi:outer membrane immunogenic protein
VKKLLVSTCAVAFLATAGSAVAADLPRAPVYKAPIVAPVPLWTGFYLGVNVGYSWGRSETTGTLSSSTTGLLLATGASKFDMNGVVGGGQIGYNWQLNNWVLGIEADIQGSAQKGSTSFLCPVGGCTALTGINPPIAGPAVGTTFNQSLDWFGTVRGRAGVLVTPDWLLYATGGLAYGDVATNGTISTIAAVPVAASFSTNSTQVGWTVGAGLEGRLGGNWTGKIEYLYMDLGTVNGGPLVTTIPALGGGFVTGNFSSKITDNILRVGVNYQFH